MAEIRRYPVKSLLGEVVEEAAVEARGLAGDRLWALRDPDGKLGSGKDTRRFRRMPGLFSLRAVLTAAGPVVELPDGHRVGVADPEDMSAVAAAVGRDVTITREDRVLHHDEGPVSLITAAGLAQLAMLHAGPVEAERFRANLLIDTGAAVGFPEDGWLGRSLRVGAEVVLRVRRPLTRCVMIDLPQDGLPGGRLLQTIGAHRDLTFGVWATVERPGRIVCGDVVALNPVD